jgi:hypothetical protein
VVAPRGGLRTDRLHLRQWVDADLRPFAELNADPEVMRFFPAPLTRAESDALARREQSRIAARGWGLWAVEARGVSSFIGLVGLNEPSFAAHFTPAVDPCHGALGNGPRPSRRFRPSTDRPGTAPCSRALPHARDLLSKAFQRRA